MVSDTRSARKSREELDRHDLKQKVNTRKVGKTIKASTTRRMTTSPLNARKSNRLDKEVPPSTPVKRTSERLVKCDTPNSLRRSGRGKKDVSSSSASKGSAEEPLSKPMKKKEKTLSQVTMESKKAELDLEGVGMKRKKMNSRKFKSFFKRQRIREITPDGDNELEKPENLVDDSRKNDGCLGAQSMEDTEDVGDDCSIRMVGLRDESINRTSEGALQDSTLSDMPDSLEKSSLNCSSTENYDAFQSGPDSSISANCSDRCIYHEDVAASASLVCEKCNLEGPCHLCLKSKRMGYDSPAQELCSCSLVDEDPVSCATCKARTELEAALSLESAGKGDCGRPLIGRYADFHMDDAKRLCGLCSKDGDLLFCKGKSCMRCYHLSCLDPPLTAALPGVWHCPLCVKKKLLFGVYTVSDGVESICDVREVEVPNAEGVRQRQFLVKYQGLAHFHNHWVPEKRLLLEKPDLVSNFNENDQIKRWSEEWMVPHRLLWKRPVQEKLCVASSSVIWVCEYEWLVKWHGLNYDHATWELDNAKFLSSSLGDELVKDYEMRRGKAKQGDSKPYTESILGHSEIPDSRPHADENHALKNVNKLHEFLLKCPNAVVFDDQERATSAISFFRSMIETFRPLLIVTTYDSLSRWEADFERLSPLVDVVVYNGSSDTRKMIRASEFLDEGGRVMVQVLLSSVEDVLEDLENLGRIKWKAVIIDEYHYSGIANGLEQIKTLPTEMRILLISGQIKDTISDYLKILSLVESPADFDKLRSLKSDTNDNLCKLKDRLSRFIAYGRPSLVSKFIEYWVPVQISNLQLEHYCSTLLSNTNALCSCSTKDPFGILPEILLTLRKCCYHPYLVDPSVQTRLFADEHPPAEILDIGIKASGKLQLLDVMLSEIKARGLQVLILFQLIGSGPLSTGNILHDFLFQRFGLDTYERVDAAYSPFEKQAAVNRFNKKETGQFVFLLENRACSSLIKLSSLDVVILYDSDWNPANDMRALNKLSVDSKAEQIKVFRLYSSFTVEERALILAKQNINLDHSSQHFSRNTSNTLLSWGVTYLFSKLDEYHANSNSSSVLNFSSGQLLLDEVTKELKSIFTGNLESHGSKSVISEAKLDAGSYSTKTLIFGESEVQLKDGEVPHVFWRNLLEWKNPQWKHIMSPSPRNRKRVHYWEGSPNNSKLEKDNTTKKRKKMVNESPSPDPTSCQDELVEVEVDKVMTPNGGPSTIKAGNPIENIHRDGQSSLRAEVSATAASKERVLSSDEQPSMHSGLQRDMKTLCLALKLPDNVVQVAELFLEYVINNHHVNSNSRSIAQAFQISLCWVAASITKQKVDKKELLTLAKQLLDYECTEEQASSVYSKMRSLKKMYMQCSDNIARLKRDGLLVEEDSSRGPSNVNGMELHCSTHEDGSRELESEEIPTDKEHAERQISTQQKVELNDKAGASETYEITKIQKKCEKRMKKLLQKHQQQIQELSQIWEDKSAELERDNKLRSAVIRSIHGQTALGMEKLKLLGDDFKKKIEDHQILKDVQLKNLEVEHLAAVNEEEQKATSWLAKAKAFSSELRVINGHKTPCSQSDDVDKLPKQLENGNPNNSCSAQDRDATPSISPVTAPPDAICNETLFENYVNSENGVEVESFEVGVELLNQSDNSSDNREAAHTNTSLPEELVSNEEQLVDSTEHPVVDRTIPNEVQMSDDLVGQRSESEVAVSNCLHGPTQPLLNSEQTVVPSDSGDALPQKDSDALDEENQSGPEIEIAEARTTDSVVPTPSNCEPSITDNILTPESSAPVSLSDDVTQTAEPEKVEVALHESTSQIEGNLETRHDCLDAGTPLGVSSEQQNVESSAVMPNDTAISHETVNTLERPSHAVMRNDVASTSERPNRPVLENDVATTSERLSQSAGNLHGLGIPLNSNQPISWSSAPSSSPDPLQIELERMHKETEQMDQKHVEMLARLKSDFEKEMEELRNRYEVKCRETQDGFRLRRNEHDKNKQKLLLNKLLANAFRSKCLETRPPHLLSTQQGIPSFMLPPSVRPPGPPLRLPTRSPVTTTPAVQTILRNPATTTPAVQTFPRNPATTTPAVQTIPHLSRSHSMRPSPVAIRNMTAHPIQHAAALASGNSARPPVIGAFTPATTGSAGKSRSVAPPHLQPCRPTTGAPVQPEPSSSVPQLTQPGQQLTSPPGFQPKPTQPPAPPGFPPQPPPAGLVGQQNGEVEGGARGGVGGGYQRVSGVPDIPSTFQSLEQSDLELLGNAVGNQSSAAVDSHVVCLSDDE